MQPEPCAGRWDGLWLACVAGVSYGCAARYDWHGYDSLAWLNLYRTSATLPGHEWHTFYYPALAIGNALVAPFGGSVYEAGLACSAIGTAIAIAIGHAAARTIGLDRIGALFAALLIATCPAILYFATVVEVPGVALPFAACSWLAMARWVRRPSVANAVIVGASLALGFLAHPTIALAGLAMVPLYQLRNAPAAWPRLVVGGGVAFAVLVLGAALLPELVRTMGGATDPDTSLRFFERRSQMASPGVSLFVREWLVPHLPTSVMVLALLAVRGARLVAAGALLATVPFQVVNCSMLLDGECEWGAYATALTGPCAIVVVHCVRSPWLRSAAVLAGVATGMVLLSTLQPEQAIVDTRQAFAAARTNAGAEVHWLIGDGAGPDGRVWLTDRSDYGATVLAQLLLDPIDQLSNKLDKLDAFVAAQQARGAVVLVTSTTLDTLRQLAAVPGAAMLDAWFARHEPRPIAAAGKVTFFALAADRAAATVEQRSK